MNALYFAAIRDRLKTDREVFRLDKPVTVERFFRENLAPRLPGVGMERLLFAVNEEMAGPDHLLGDADTLAVLPPLSGGLEPARLQTKDFDMNEETRLCIGSGTDAGGVATFVGVVRDVSRGKKVKKIELACYEGMAKKALANLRSAAMEKFDVLNVTVVHRTGTLRPGERIVGIVAAARHRKEAFDACRWTIDELKKTVPLWKKEFTEDGETWVEGL